MGETSPKLPILCQVGRKTTTQLINEFLVKSYQMHHVCVNSVCRVGAYGAVRVHYTTYAVDTVSEATAEGSNVLDYYNSPLSGTPLPLAAQTGTSWDVASLTNPLEVCTASSLVILIPS